MDLNRTPGQSKERHPATCAATRSSDFAAPVQTAAHANKRRPLLWPVNPTAAYWDYVKKIAQAGGGRYMQTLNMLLP